MSEAFSVERLQTRQFRATHIPTGKVFELRGRQAVHYWAAYEVDTKKNVVSKALYLEDWQSKKRLLENLHERIMQRIEKDKRAAELERAKSEEIARLHAIRHAAKRERFKPEVYAKLGKKSYGKNSTLIKAMETGQEFLMTWDKEGYTINIMGMEHGTKRNPQQPICVGMETEQAALLELYYYLDTPEITEDYLSNCFRKR